MLLHRRTILGKVTPTSNRLERLASVSLTGIAHTIVKHRVCKAGLIISRLSCDLHGYELKCFEGMTFLEQLQWACTGLSAGLHRSELCKTAPFRKANEYFTIDGKLIDAQQ